MGTAVTPASYRQYAALAPDWSRPPPVPLLYEGTLSPPGPDWGL